MNGVLYELNLIRHVLEIIALVYVIGRINSTLRHRPTLYGIVNKRSLRSHRLAVFDWVLDLVVCAVLILLYVAYVYR